MIGLEIVGDLLLVLSTTISARMLMDSEIAPKHEGRLIESEQWKYVLRLGPFVNSAVELLERIEPYAERTRVIKRKDGNLYLFEQSAPGSAISGAATMVLETKKKYAAPLLISTLSRSRSLPPSFKQKYFKTLGVYAFCNKPEILRWAVPDSVYKRVAEISKRVSAPVTLVVYQHAICVQVLKPKAVTDAAWIEILEQDLLDSEQEIASFD